MQAHIVAGLGFGDEGKATSVDYLTRLYGATLNVRYNGGPQAAHNVVLPNGQQHTFAQICSGYFVPGVMTYLSRHMLVEPFALFKEAKRLRTVNGDEPFDRLIVDQDCLVVTPFHWIVNRVRETTRGAYPHGSCGMGIGEARGDALNGFPSLYFRDLALPLSELKHKLQAIRDAKKQQCPTEQLNSVIVDHLAENYQDVFKQLKIGNTPMLKDLLRKNVSIFEGAQGVLLDETYGFPPHNTWTDTTFRNAHELLSGTGVKSRRIGIMRSFMTRHGAGPMPTETTQIAYEGDHNVTNMWQGRFRFGYLDLVLIKYAIKAAGGVDGLFLTHCDKIPQMRGKEWVRYFTRYDGNLSTDAIEDLPFGLHSRQLELENGLVSKYTDDLRGTLRNTLNVPVLYTSSGPTYLNKARCGVRLDDPSDHLTV